MSPLETCSSFLGVGAARQGLSWRRPFLVRVAGAKPSQAWRPSPTQLTAALAAAASV